MIYIFVTLSAIFIIAMALIAYQFISGNWRLFIDFEEREYDCETCDGLPVTLKRLAD